MPGDRMVGRGDDQRSARRRDRVEREHPVDRRIENAEGSGDGQPVISGIAAGHHRPLVRTREVGDRRRRLVGRWPALADHHVVQGQPPRPPMPLEPRIGRPLVRPAEAEPAEGLDARRQAQQAGQVGGLKERHPAEAEAGRAGGQPHVLDRAGAAPQVGVAQGRPAENPGRGRPSVAGDDDADRGLPDAVELEVEEPGAAIGGELPGLPEPLAVREQRGPVAGGLLADHDEPPRLRVPDRRRLMAGRQHLTEQVGGHRVGPVAADVTPRGEHRAQGGDRRFAERPAGRVDRPIGRRRRIPDQGNRARPRPLVLLAHRSATPISVTAVADSISAPNTSPVTPPSRRTACSLNR